MFPILSFDQANPVMTGMTKMLQQRYQGLLNNQLATQNSYLPQNLAEQLRGMSIGNDLKDVQLQYAPQMTQADLALKNAQVPYINSQTALNVGTLPYLGMKFTAPYLNAQAKMLQAGTGVSNSFKSWSQTPEGQAIIQKYPGIAESVFNSMNTQGNLLNNGIAGGGMLNGGMQGSGMGGGMANPGIQNNPNVPNITPNQSAPNMPNNQAVNLPVNNAGIADAAAGNAGASNMHSSMAPSGAPSSYPQLALSDKEVARLQKIFAPAAQNPAASEASNIVQGAAQDAYIKKNYPADVQKRIYAGDRFKTTANQVMQNFDGAKDYFSPQGQLQLRLDMASAARGNVPPRLQAYRNFVQGIEQLNVQGAMLEGVPADQVSRGAYNKVLDLAKFTNTPEGARQQLINGINLGLLADSVNRKRPSELVNQPDYTYSTNQAAKQNQAGTAASSSQNYTDADIQHTAQKYGMTVDQVKQKLGIR